MHLDIQRTTIRSNRPKSLVYNSNPACHTEFMGAFPKATPRDGDAAIYNFPEDRIPPLGYSSCPGGILTSAPLRHVLRADVFLKDRGTFCRGVVLAYDNGGQRAVGDCRVGIEPFERYENPKWLCSSAATTADQMDIYRTDLVRVRFAGDAAQGHEEEGWECQAMDGILKFWVSNESQHLHIVPDKTGGGSTQGSLGPMARTERHRPSWPCSSARMSHLLVSLCSLGSHQDYAIAVTNSPRISTGTATSGPCPPSSPPSPPHS